MAIRSEAGIGYVAILVLLAVLSTLSLAFIQKVGMQQSVVMNQKPGMQAHYLAESGANHALWRLLNEPGFPASETVYYMHSLANGRYGYKVRKPTLTTFATVATVGAVGNVITEQSYVQYLRPYNILTGYSTQAGPIPKHRRLIGASWSENAADTVSIGPDSARWIVLRGCPVTTRTEIIMGTIDGDKDINLAVWDGTSWGNLTEFAVNTEDSQYRCFDIAYENQSGDALVVGQYDGGKSVGYNVWDGNAWVFSSPQQDANLTPEDDLRYLTMASKPRSDEILIGAVQKSKDLKVIQWDGASFNDQGEIETDMEVATYGSAEIVYEQQSGDALILWTQKDKNQIYYRVWDGTTLGPEGQLPSFGGDLHVIRAAADPTSDHILVAAVDDFYDLNVAVWDGNAWIDSRELTTGVVFDYGQVFDLAWEHSGQDAMVAWAPWGGGYNVRYFSWRKGTPLADHAVQVGPSVQNNIPWVIRLFPISGTAKVILLVRNNSNELRYSLWTGNAFLGNPAILLESSLPVVFVPFDIAESGVTYTGGSG
jgi:hypothetical protein